MAIDAEDVRVIGTGNIYVADVGTAAPTFADDLADETDWTDLGYITTDGITFSFSKDTTDINAFQTTEAIRSIITAQTKEVSFTLMQLGRDQFNIALGGGEWTTNTGVYTYEPPDVSAVDERSVIIRLVDGTLVYRWYFPRAVNKSNVEFKAVRSEAMTLPITMTVLQPGGQAKPFNFVTNDPASVAPVGP